MPVARCPLITSSCQSSEELAAGKPAEIRAYKLSRQRWSYNRCKLVLHTGNSIETFPTVQRAVDATTVILPPDLQEGAVAFRVDLREGGALAVHVHLVYDNPRELEPLATDGTLQRRFEWFCVSRAACSRSCQGPLLRTVQRFGPVGGRRSDSTDCSGLVKSPDDLHISIDEASSHQQDRRFRLIFGAFTPDGSKLLGTACSSPVRVIANNDVPQGPGAFHVSLNLSHCPSALIPSCQSADDEPGGSFPDSLRAGLKQASTGARWTQDYLLKMIHSTEGKTYAARNNATPVLLLMYACSCCQQEEGSSSAEHGCLQLLGLGEMQQRYSKEVEHVQYWCNSPQNIGNNQREAREAAKSKANY